LKETREKRSQIMRAVKGKDTTPELLVRRLVFALGYRYRLHGAHLPGKPDLYFTAKKKAIFVHGCFWHGHPCKRGDRMPAANREYWLQKISRNKARDKNNLVLLREQGWDALVLWECELKEIERLKQEIVDFIVGGSHPI
jgi:DNA mismatch endonuclease, patch repair protein